MARKTTGTAQVPDDSAQTDLSEPIEFKPSPELQAAVDAVVSDVTVPPGTYTPDGLKAAVADASNTTPDTTLIPDADKFSDLKSIAPRDGEAEFDALKAKFNALLDILTVHQSSGLAYHTVAEIMKLKDGN